MTKERKFSLEAGGVWGRVVFSALALSLALAGYGCSKEEAASGGFSMPPMPVEVALAQVQKISDRFEAVGTIEAAAAITVVSEIDAAVIRLPFAEGSALGRGALIAQLDDSQLAAEVARAEALRAQSQATYDRVKVVVAQKAGAPQDLDDAAAALKVAEANLTLAKARAAKTRITAPFSGIIGARKVSVGSFLRSGQAIGELVDIDEIRVTFSAPERFLSLLNRGAPIAVSTAAYPDHQATGEIIVVEPVLDAATRSVRVVARVANPERKFLPGMSATISVVLNERPDAIVIPNEAVFANGGQFFVFAVKADTTVVRVAIALGMRLADVVEVTQGLAPGAQVVRAGHQKLFEGARVMPIAAQGAAAAK
ncbi:MAG: efflux RND transporter periplasmic adaptor subunit [Candidatus Latescibacteria bacterium]|nr:efflux RND transporter periplasmic adaptor subunit [Candidatus Latescibacterota bacterium]